MSDAYTARPTRTRLLRLLSFVLTTKARFREMHSFSGPIGPAGQWTPAKEMGPGSGTVARQHAITPGGADYPQFGFQVS
jgi:hypothetical protein